MSPRIYKGIQIPENDPARVEALKSYRIMDTPREVEFDDISELVAKLCSVPIGYIGFFDERRQWLKSSYGRPAEAPNEREREFCSCSPTILQQDMIVIPDLRESEIYCDLPGVTGPPYTRFYCSVPLVTREGFVLGTLCIQDTEPREIAPENLEWVRRLAGQVMKLMELRRKNFELQELQAEMRVTANALKEEKEISKSLIRNILPLPIAEELRLNNRVEPRYHQQVTILFSDFENFTQFSESVEPKTLVDQLNEHFSAFDEIMERHGVEKLKTIGDNYMAVSGLPTETRSHAEKACLVALEMQEAVRQLNVKREHIGLPPWNMRIGLHSGPVMAGIVGKSKFTFDIWGDAVNIAARLESAGEPGRINLSENTFQAVSHLFDFEPRGMIELKGKGKIKAYFLNRVIPALSEDSEGIHPNDEFYGRAR